MITHGDELPDRKCSPPIHYPIVYEDFLPVSAAGILQALGAQVLDEFQVYEEAEARSIDAVRSALRHNLNHSAA